MIKKPDKSVGLNCSLITKPEKNIGLQCDLKERRDTQKLVVCKTVGLQCEIGQNYVSSTPILKVKKIVRPKESPSETRTKVKKDQNEIKIDPESTALDVRNEDL